MHFTTRTATVALLAIGLSASATPLFAQGTQGTQPGQPAQPSPAQAGDISDSQVEKFAEAEEKVRSLSSKWQSKIEGAQDQDAAMQHQQEANQEIVKAVKDSGLSVQEYNKIARAAQGDPELAERIQKEG